MRRVLVLLTCGLMLAVSFTSALAAWSHDPTSEPTLFSTRSVNYPSCVTDGAGGLFVVFSDVGTGNIRVQHVDAKGVALWGGGDGIEISTAGSSIPEGIIADGFGGLICSWYPDVVGAHNLYAQRVNASGTPLWTSGGKLICNATGNQDYSALAADGYGGAFICWQDRRSGNADLYAQYVNSAGTSVWTANGLAVCSFTGDQTANSIVSDGSGGAIMSWMDARSASRAVYVQRLNGSGVAQWTAGGAALTAAIGNDEWNPKLISDGRYGAIVAWYDWRSGNADVYAQRVNNSGTPMWATNGAQITTLASDQTGCMIVPDGASGAIVAWEDGRNGNVDVYAQRVNALGVTQWTANGVALCAAGWVQNNLHAISDGAGGAIVQWADLRNGSDNDVYAQRVLSSGATYWGTDGVAVCTTPIAQDYVTLASDGAYGAFLAWWSLGRASLGRVDRFGVLGGAAPTIVSIDDVPNDQGGFVSIRWDKSWLDNSPGGQISYYYVWRQVPQVMAQAALRAGAKLAGANEEPRVGALRATEYAATTYYWEFLGSVTAMGQAGYSVVEPTRGDSIAGSNPSTLFMIEARYNLISGAYWDSEPLGGYSVDNVAPAMPAPFTGVYENGLVALQWGASTASDFAEYQLYRGATSNFVPGPSTYVGSLLDPSYADSPGVPRWYKVVAVDVHGNVSAPATLLPTGTLDVSPDASFTLAFAPPSPNPARGRATFAFTLPAAGSVRLALYDVAGRCVRVFADGAQGAGEHRLDVELRDAAGRALPAGLYLARLDAAGERRVRRLAVVR